MDLGVFILNGQRDAVTPPRQIYDEMIDQVRLAEELGFAKAWFAEHHFANYCLTPSPLSIINHVSALTSRIRLGPGVIVAPLYEPLRLIEDIALADQLSNGRLVLGFGSGYQRYEFGKFGVALDSAKDKLEETLEVVEQLYAGESIAYQGRHIRIPETFLAVRPLQARPEIFIAGHGFGRSLIERMARGRYTMFISTGWNTLPEMDATRRELARTFEGVGGSTADMPLALQMHVHVCDSREEQLRAAEGVRYIRRIAAAMRQPETLIDKTRLIEVPAPREPTLEVIAENARVGAPEKIARQLVDDLRLLEPRHISCVFNVGGGISMGEIKRSMRRFATEVLPLVEKAVGPLNSIGGKPVGRAREAAH